jgi:hypothetical protein
MVPALRRVRLPLIALVGAAASLALAGLYLTRDPRPRFRERRGAVDHVVQETASADGKHVRQNLRVTSTSGLSVDVAVKRPADAEDARRPLLVLLGGYVSGREAIDLIDDTGGTVVAALSYPFAGDPKVKGWRVVLAAPSIRRALLDTPPAVLLAIDFLATEPYVDPQRIELVGVSLGAPFACIAGALDRRVRRVWSIHGAGDLYALLDHSLERRISFAPARRLVARLAYVAACGPGLTPEKWVGEISPRPFVMVNADSDERLPRECIETLYAAAGEPREILWRPGRHVEPDRKRIVQDLVDLVLERVHETDGDAIIPRDSPSHPEIPR